MISVVTVTLNLVRAGRVDTFRRCLESVRAQASTDVEHFVQDGGSTDGTVEIIKEYASKGWLRYASEPDSGIYEAMNRGAAATSGELITFLSSDDFYSRPDGLADVASVLRRTGGDFTFSDTTVRKPDGEAWTSHCEIKRLIMRMPFPHPGHVVSRAAFNSIGGFDTGYRIIGDADFILRLYLAGFRGTRVRRPFVTFCEGGISCTSAAVGNGEWSRLFRKNYGHLCYLPEASWEEIGRTHLLPPKLSLKLALKGISPTVSRAAWYSIWLSIRKSVFY